MLSFGMQRLYVRLVRRNTFLIDSSTEQSGRLTKVNWSIRNTVIFIYHAQLATYPVTPLLLCILRNAAFNPHCLKRLRRNELSAKPMRRTFARWLRLGETGSPQTSSPTISEGARKKV